MKENGIFHVASGADIVAGRTTDVYFERTLKILRARGVDPLVTMEVAARELPLGRRWALFAGLEEALRMLGRLNAPLEVRCIEEGTVFGPGDAILSITGRYTAICLHETPLLGLICQASGIATAAARCRKAAGDRTLLSFGARRAHPCIAPMIDRSAWIGGADGVSAVCSAAALGIEPAGTMPHALVLCLGDTVDAAKAFREVIGEGARCTALVDTFGDEKFEALRVARALGKGLHAVRLDTPSSRRGDMAAICREARWELDLNGFRGVKIFVSGGLDEEKILALNPWADGYGVGTSIASAPAVDFSLDIVEMEGKPVAKRGKEAGAKRLVRCARCFARRNVPLRAPDSRCACGGAMRDMLKRFVIGGARTPRLPTAGKIRERALGELRRVEL